jgi:hypothetical protein
MRSNITRKYLIDKSTFKIKVDNLDTLFCQKSVYLRLDYKKVQKRIQTQIFHKTLPVHILQLIKVRKRFRRKKIKNNSVENKKIVNYLTNEIRSEINTLKNNNWLDFLEKQGKNPINTKPFWQRINKLKGKKISKLIPTLKFDDKQFETDVSKANLFAETLKNTFSDHNDEKFNKEHKIKLDNPVNNHDFCTKKNILIIYFFLYLTTFLKNILYFYI